MYGGGECRPNEFMGIPSTYTGNGVNGQRPFKFRKPNICGAEKRRRKIAKLKAEGVTDREAYLSVRNPRKTFHNNTNVNSTSNVNLTGSDFTPQVKPQPKEISSINHSGANIASTAPPGSKPLLFKNVAIVPQNYPEQYLHKDHLNVFRESLGTYIDNLPDDVFLPKLHTVWSEAGCILVLCKDLQSVQWINSNINKIKPWDEADLKVISTESLAEGITLWVPGPKIDSDLILKRIQRQNEGLEVTSWKVIERKEQEDRVCLELLVDKGSVEKIRNKSFELYCGAVKAVVKPVQQKH